MAGHQIMDPTYWWAHIKLECDDPVENIQGRESVEYQILMCRLERYFMLPGHPDHMYIKELVGTDKWVKGPGHSCTTGSMFPKVGHWQPVDAYETRMAIDNLCHQKFRDPVSLEAHQDQYLQPVNPLPIWSSHDKNAR
ncbi:hypothetical protein M422DRAFT_48414 [Sphaerobolus stellatus SS14]|uniref:Uncharacterized protein n=1 Tax=Sphaerobolus stellatus (strain SS14) TaxID=990650 RepID=A0A0C9VTU7_SPHS4|nr:hypothetical protein M422DRAFT_48414 [Sphaerobolus stellatus SS14]